MWGWPNRFLNRMADADTRVILVAGAGEFSAGFDTPEDIKRLPLRTACINYTWAWINRLQLEISVTKVQFEFSFLFGPNLANVRLDLVKAIFFAPPVAEPFRECRRCGRITRKRMEAYMEHKLRSL